MPSKFGSSSNFCLYSVWADAAHFGVYPVHLLYATLLADDKDRDVTLASLDISKKRLLTVAKRDVLTFQLSSVSESSRARGRWN
jgi:hypothetical protein